MVPDAPQKAPKNDQKSDFGIKAGMHDLAAIYFTLAIFVPPGTQKPRPRRVKKQDDFPTSVFANSIPKWTPKDVHVGTFEQKKT